MKRFFALVLALVMVLQLCPLTAMAEIDYSRFRTAESVNDVPTAAFAQVVFEYDDGTLVKKLNVQTGKTVGSEEMPTAEARTGFDFVGWFDGETEITADTPITSSITATAKYTKKAGWYTVTFYNRDAQVHKAVTLEANTAIGTLPPVIGREDYTAYWAIGELRYNGQSYEPVVTGARINDTYIVTGDVSIVPDYEEIKYTVSFYENADDTEAQATVTVDVNTSYCVNDIPQVPVRTGYTGKWVYDGGDFNNDVSVKADTKVWAEYTQNVFTVTYMVDGEKYQEDTYNEGEALTLPAAPVVEGEEFEGWFVGETQYKGGESVAENLTLTAKFKGEYSVIFVVRTGNEEKTISQYFRKEGEKVDGLPESPFIGGKIFDKWVLDGTETTVTTDMVVTGNIKVVALFRDVEIYTIIANYYYKKDSGEDFIFNTEIYEIDKAELSYTVDVPDSTKTQGDYVAGSPVYYATQPTVTVEESNFVLDGDKYKYEFSVEYVKYTAEYDFVYLLKNLDNENYTEIPGTREHEHGVLNSKVTPTVKSFPYAKLEKAENAEITQEAGQELPVYYTRKDFQLSYDTNGGSYVAGATVPYGTTVSLPAVNPTRNGYAFEGWYLDAALTQSVTDSITVNADTTVYAKWKGNDIGYTIIYMKEVYNNATHTTSYVYENSRDATGTVGTTVYAASAPGMSGTLNGYERDAAMNGTATSAGAEGLLQPDSVYTCV